ncbi:MAG: hypothetical protein HY291_00910 [Planctomycetes bacterium]|nr:hypothetical protein [Planctomycetota bacterium]
MAVQEATQHPDATTSAAPLSSWGGLVAKLVFLLIGLLIAFVVVMVVNTRNSEATHLKDRQGWDDVYQALKDAKDDKEKVAALEGVWSKVDTSSAHPYVMLELAQEQYQLAVSEQRPAPERKRSLDRAKQVFDLVREREGKHPLYGGLASEGSAACREQAGDLDGAIQVLTDAVGRYESHFLHTKLCYELGRAYWMRSLKSADAKDREEALRWEDKAIQDTQDNASRGFRWREEAQFIKSVLEKHGPAWPDSAPPPAKPAVEQKTSAEKTPDAKTAEEKSPAEPKKADAPADPKAAKSEK